MSHCLLITEFGLVTPEAVTIAQQLVNRQTTKTQLINDGFSRYSLNSKEGLPSWFLDDEAKFYKPNLPITKEAVAALREKQRALDARPIKKIAEAKARKKFKAHQRLEKALKKAEGVNATADMSEREKAQQIEKVMRKGASSSKKAKDIKVVVAKGAHKGIKGRPKGVKGRYTMVDSRMKKEVCRSYNRVFLRLTWSVSSFELKSGQKRQTRNVRRTRLIVIYDYTSNSPPRVSLSLPNPGLRSTGVVKMSHCLRNDIQESSDTASVHVTCTNLSALEELGP